ncbi:MAG: FG-GAP-like repeat-containing protein, partial [Myxococcota bacterium]
EVCEDGNTTGGDGCSADCASAEVCGNGVLDATESCDDANTLPGDGCDATCRIEGATCGDGNLQPTEGCDDGNVVDGDGCAADCVLESCGNGTIEVPEICDDGNAIDTDDCPRTCRPATCGDAAVHPTEQCDDGNLVPGDGCSPACRLEQCGNGFLDPGEICDDANTIDTDSCVACAPATCGDGFVHTGFEACDDGNAVAGDGCSDTCDSDETCGNGILDPGEVCDDNNLVATDTCTTVCQVAACGDGFLHLGFEGCDDGNLVNGDGCSDQCVPDGCGSGVVDPGEECDDGGANGTLGSSCFANCVSTAVAFTALPDRPTTNTTNALTPRRMGSGDLNGDGFLDLVIPHQSTDTVVTSYGLGDGRFWIPQDTTTAGRPEAVVMADFDGDGLPDVASATTSSFVGVSLTSGDPLSGTVSTSISPGLGPVDIATGDVNGDTHLDLVTANRTTSDLTVLLNDGAGGFTFQATYALGGGTSPEGVAIGDVTGDGIADIVSANSGSDSVTVIPGLGSGVFGVVSVYSTRLGANGDSPTDVVLADFDGDALLDVATANDISDDIVVFISNGATGLATPIAFTMTDGLGGGDFPTEIAVGDLNGDLEPDVVTANFTSSDVTVRLGVAGGAAFGPAVVVALGGAQSPSGLEIVDLDGDGNLDVLTSNRDTDDVAVLTNDGTGALSFDARYRSELGYGAGGQPQDLAVGDVDGDGEPDVAVAGGLSPYQIVLLGNNGLGDLLPTQSAPTLDQPLEAVVADLDGNGLQDWAIASTISLPQWAWGIQQVNGGFQQIFSPGNTSHDDYTSIVLADFDQDNDLDAALGFDSDTGVALYRNNGNGGFTYVTLLNTSTIVRHVAAADLNGDNDPELVAVLSSNDEVQVFTGITGVAFAGGNLISTGNSTQGDNPVYVELQEVTGDSFIDILTANASSGDVSLLAGTGSGNFAPVVTIPMALGGGSAGTDVVRTGDFNQDGILDLAATHASRDTVGVSLGFGGGA